MKNLQKIAVALLVGIMAIGFSAFKAETNKSNNKLVGELWFEYISPSTLPASYTAPSNYDLAGDGSEEPECATGTYIRCAVHAKPSSSNPSQPDMATVIATRNRAQ